MNLTRAVLLLNGLVLSVNAENCDIERLRLGNSYYFNNIINNTKEDIYVGEQKMFFKENKKKGDYNGEENPESSIKESTWLKDRKSIIKKNEKGSVLETTKPYHILYTPKVRGKNNLYIKYDTKYWTKDSNGKWNKKSNWMSSCINYEITWCGDGIKDIFLDKGIKKYDIKEECDPADPSKESWGTGGCSTSCTKVQIPKKFESCESTFNRKLRHGNSYQFTDYFINNSNMTLHFDEYFMNFDEIESHGNFNAGNNPSINFTKRFIDKDYILRPSESIVTAITNKNYPITHRPVIRSFDNLKIEYLAKYYEVKNNGKYVGPFFHSTCVNYEITSCGDGIKDNYTEQGGKHIFEECDDGNNKSGDGCSNTCQLEN